MPLLIESNPYLRDAEVRQRMIIEDAFQSSIFEGAQGIKRHGAPVQTKRRVIASAKKADKASSRPR